MKAAKYEKRVGDFVLNVSQIPYVRVFGIFQISVLKSKKLRNQVILLSVQNWSVN